MKQYFDEVSYGVSKLVTQKYSTSFSLGILALKPSLRTAIYAIYGYVRLADEIVDSFHEFDKAALLSRLSEETDRALAERISLNPILQSFQETVHLFDIDRDLIRHFLKSMHMDLHKIDYRSEEYQEYIYGSAEVVGLMCLHVFTEGDKAKFTALQPYARKLGSAFQKINFLRDLKDDYHLLGRSYFPNVDLSQFNNAVKMQIEQEIRLEFAEALIGIKKLPTSARFGVYLAYKYYISLFQKITKRSSNDILHRRIRIPNSEKLVVALGSYLRYKTAGI